MKSLQQIFSITSLLGLIFLLSSFGYVPASESSVLGREDGKGKEPKTEQSKKQQKAEKRQFKLNQKLNKVSATLDAETKTKRQKRLKMKLDKIRKQMEGENTTIATLAMIFGIIALSLCLLGFSITVAIPQLGILFWIAWPLGIAAIVLGALGIGFANNKSDQFGGRAKAKLGLIFGIVTISLMVILTIIILILIISVL
ncbi:MAG: hypothetical protein MK212_18420 [Saprospiraceae bacterium]|nr:hypothetical protein [Saprospiraceae bacterium]